MHSPGSEQSRRPSPTTRTSNLQTGRNILKARGAPPRHLHDLRVQRTETAPHQCAAVGGWTAVGGAPLRKNNS